MGCSECGRVESTATRVSYVDGTTETLQLCPECRAAFEDGGFVRNVELLRSTRASESACLAVGPAGQLVRRADR